jgi:hypothetical protein
MIRSQASNMSTEFNYFPLDNEVPTASTSTYLTIVLMLHHVNRKSVESLVDGRINNLLLQKVEEVLVVNQIMIQKHEILNK